jgi:hypothetical protein
MATTKISANVLASGAALTNINVGSTIDFTKNTSISGNLTVDTSTFFVDATNNRVGIGTSTPSYKLDVNGDMSAGAIYTTDAATTRSNLGLDMQVKVKAATDSVTSSTTFVSDSELRNFSVVANAVYRVDFNLFASIGAGGIKLQLLTTSNQAPNGAILGTVALGTVGPSNITSTSTTIIDLRLRSTAAAAVVPICGYFYFSCTANDTVSLQFAQNSSNVAATELRPNSCVRITKIS